MTFARATSAVAKGLIAGAAGTAAVTAFQMIEMKVKKRPPSTAPAEAVEKVLEVEPQNEDAEQRLAGIVHWGYGTAWGGLRGVMGALGLREPNASLLFFSGVWGGALVMLPKLGLAPAPKKWGAPELSTDALRHAVYAGATGAVYELLDR
jgi:hypothetical protein